MGAKSGIKSFFEGFNFRSFRQIMPYTHRKRRFCAAQTATCLVCIEQYMSTGSKPVRYVSWAPRQVTCSVHVTQSPFTQKASRLRRTNRHAPGVQRAIY